MYKTMGYILQGFWRDKTDSDVLKKSIIPQVAAYESLRWIIDCSLWEQNIWEGYIPEESWGEWVAAAYKVMNVNIMVQEDLRDHFIVRQIEHSKVKVT